MTAPCQCDAPGPCNRFRCSFPGGVAGRVYEWCRGVGVGITAEGSESMRARWDKQEADLRAIGCAPIGPGLIQQITNLASDAVAHAADSFKVVPEAVYQERLASCQTCPLYRDNQCSHKNCGCRMAGDWLAALRWASKRCPLDEKLDGVAPRWLEHIDDSQAA